MIIPLHEPNEVYNGYPRFKPEVFETDDGVSYLKEAGVSLLAKTEFNSASMIEFLSGFDPSLGFMGHLADDHDLDDPCAGLCKTAGQLCYMSFGPNRTKNEDAARYFGNILASGHGSVLEHACYSFLFYGVDRATTHELVRHRHMSFSQVSQRYVDGTKLRFVERPEYQPERLPSDAGIVLKQDVKWAHEKFESMANSFVNQHEIAVENLSEARECGHPMLQGGTATEKRKHLNQVAREMLPNCTEAPIVVTGNVRAWRGFVDQRATPHADVPIRELAVKVLKCLVQVSPLLFGDYVIAKQEDGTETAVTKWRKV